MKLLPILKMHTKLETPKYVSNLDAKNGKTLTLADKIQGVSVSYEIINWGMVYLFEDQCPQRALALCWGPMSTKEALVLWEVFSKWVPLIWAVERWDLLTAHIDVCSKQSLIWAVGKIPKNCGFVLPLILMIAFRKH